jgi:multiple sugar transport system permease protein
MAILNRIQRRSPGGRLLMLCVYVVLAIGATTMVYPFLLMLNGAMAGSDADTNSLEVLPPSLFNNDILFQNYLEKRYGSLSTFELATLKYDADGRRLYSYDTITLPQDTPPALIHTWEGFLKKSDVTQSPYFALGHVAGGRLVAELQLRYQKMLAKRFPDLPRKDHAAGTAVEHIGSRRFQPVQGAFAEVYREMRSQADPRYFYPYSIRGFFIQSTVRPEYPTTREGLAKLNADWGTNYSSFAEVELPPVPPQNPTMKAAWWLFVQKSLAGNFIELDASLLPAYQQALQNKYQNLDRYNRSHGTHWTTWQEIPVPARPRTSLQNRDIEDFVARQSAPDGLSVTGADFEWTDYLRSQFKEDLQALNRDFGTSYKRFEDVPMPLFEYDAVVLMQHRTEILWEMLTRNYRVAWNLVFTNGNAFKNTIWFCFLSVLTGLIVNPLAAYALSRFRPPWTQQVLFVMMATMAFPGEVTQIPSFLLIRDLGMLNTFAALVIPGAASGFSIFLLKGFFDSLPTELYEAADMDGCGRIRAFFMITVPMSTPILALTALGSFTGAYGAFTFALLVCQDESMWTLMVYIYQLQQSYSQPIVFAALIIASIPTLVIFVFCQDIIMRGIVVPVEK